MGNFTTQSINVLWIRKRKVSLRPLFCLPIVSRRKSEKKLEMCQWDTDAPPRAVVWKKQSLYRTCALNTLCTCVSVAVNIWNWCSTVIFNSPTTSSILCIRSWRCCKEIFSSFCASTEKWSENIWASTRENLSSGFDRVRLKPVCSATETS